MSETAHDPFDDAIRRAAGRPTAAEARAAEDAERERREDAAAHRRELEDAAAEYLTRQAEGASPPIVFDGGARELSAPGPPKALDDVIRDAWMDRA